MSYAYAERKKPGPKAAAPEKRARMETLSQQRGEVTGSGFLNDYALEARGESVYGGATAPLSAASAAPAAGPMQAKRNKGETTQPQEEQREEEPEYESKPNDLIFDENVVEAKKWRKDSYSGNVRANRAYGAVHGEYARKGKSGFQRNLMALGNGIRNTVGLPFKRFGQFVAGPAMDRAYKHRNTDISDRADAEYKQSILDSQTDYDDMVDEDADFDREMAAENAEEKKKKK